MKRKSTGILIAVFAIFALLLSCTLPIYIGTAPTEEEEEEVTEAPTLSPTVTETPTPTSTATLSVTPTVSVNLDGPWTIWQGTSQQMLNIDFLQQGYSLVGNAATGDGYSMLFEGTISTDGLSVTGQWNSTKGTSGSFIMYLNSSYTTFLGNLGGGVPFCGNRMNTSMPSPCLQ